MGDDRLGRGGKNAGVFLHRDDSPHRHHPEARPGNVREEWCGWSGVFTWEGNVKEERVPK